MSEQIVPTDLPPRLNDVLEEIAGSEHGPRFRLLFFAAATAIDVLADLDFTRYEIDEQSHGEGLWEALAPAVEDTTNSVGAFLECVRSLFAVEIAEREATDAELDSWFEELESRAADAPAGVIGSPERQLKEVTAVLQSICDGLTHEMGRFERALGELQSNPNRWLLLDHIAMFRGKCRNGIGAMVYMAARLFLDVTREEVVPAYRDDVDDAVLVRCELARLREGVQMHGSTLQRELDGAALRTLGARVLADVDAFCESPAFLTVRAADKHHFGSARRELRSLLESDTLEHPALHSFMEGLTRFLESLCAINRRETLMLHDIDAIGEVRRHLCAARAAAEMHDGQPARDAVQSALARSERLCGRDELFDAVCRVLQRVPLEQLTSLEILSVVRMMEAPLEANPPARIESP